MLHLLGGIAQVKVDIAIKEAEYVMVQMDDIIMGTDREDVIMEISAIQLMGNESIVGRINHHIHLAVLVHLVPQGVAEIVLLEDIKIKTVKDRVKIVVVVNIKIKTNKLDAKHVKLENHQDLVRVHVEIAHLVNTKTKMASHLVKIVALVHFKLKQGKLYARIVPLVNIQLVVLVVALFAKLGNFKMF
jgi:hypothetical protein